MDTQFAYPEPLGVSKAAVEDFAPKVASKLKFESGSDITSLVGKLGGRIVVGSSGNEDSESGSMIARSKSDFTIFLSPLTSLERDRFTVAHELGHLLLHFPKILREKPGVAMRATRHVDSSDKKQQRAEWEANWFAAAFLMPASEFSAAYKNGVEYAQNKFQVSSSAVKARAQSLGL